MKFTTKKLLLINVFVVIVVIFILVSNKDFYLKGGNLHQSNLKTRLQKMEMQYETKLTKDFTKNDIKNLEIKANSEVVKIYSGNKFKVYIRHLIHKDQKPVLYLKNKTLSLKTFTKKADYLVFRPKIEITIPIKTKLNNLTITNKNAKTDIDSLQIKTTKLRLYNGILICKKFTNKTLKIIAQNEEIRFNKVNLKSLNLENKKGDIDLYKLTITKLSTIKNIDGDITLTKATAPGLDISTKMGKVQIYGKNQKKLRYKAENRNLMLKVQTNIGDIEVK
ncbi:MAG: DUF4097 domain-containing protein [Streptococcaceae bacterium]|jgi:hypothetical protein|nr:DUF4097 domain-containing protein [Streptococcaceae bacterium]